jgi:hypothetical protein
VFANWRKNKPAMKKMILLAAVAALFFACGPKRMSCYGKRCVDAKAAPAKPQKHEA